MKIAMQWLADYLPGPLDAAAAGEALTHGGLPVEVIEQVAGDTVIDVEVTSNRGDCLSHVGVARELAALLGRTWQEPAGSGPDGSSTVGPLAAVSVRIDAPDLCPHYTARVIDGVRVGPSPEWLRGRLEAIGLRSINNIVDVTNYVMFELGQPLHAFDFDRLSGGRIVVRRARSGEKLTTLDGKESLLREDYLAICDAEKPVALAGVMGGRDSEVSPGTTTILLEAARFDPLVVRKAARAIVRSDSSYRFERGIDPLLPEKASRRAAELICQLAGGTLRPGVATAGAPGYTPKTLTLRLARLGQVLGVSFPPAQVVDALQRLQLNPALSADGEVIAVVVPSHRLDLNIEVDLIEEVARIIGYDKVPVRDEISIRVAAVDPNATTVRTVREALVAAGYFESVTVGFVSDTLAADFTPADADPADPLPRVSALVRKENARLRPSILPGLLESARRNENAGVRDARLFEIGSIFYNAVGGRLVERQVIGLVGSTELREVRGTVEMLLTKLDAGRAVAVTSAALPGFDRAAAGMLTWGGVVVGQFGRIDATVAGKLGLRDRVCVAELDMAAVIGGAQHVPQLRPLPQYPPAERDLSLVVSEAVRYESVEALISAARLQHLESSQFVTTYRGKPLEKGQKSVTLRLVFRSDSGTLTNQDVDREILKLVEQAKSSLDAKLRV